MEEKSKAEKLSKSGLSPRSKPSVSVSVPLKSMSEVPTGGASAGVPLHMDGDSAATLPK